MNHENNLKLVHDKALSLGAHLFGVAATDSLRQTASSLNETTLDQLGYAISLGVRLSNAIIEDIYDRPTLIYLHHYRQVNYHLDRMALALADFIQSTTSCQALPIAASQVIDWQNQKAHLSHKHVARQAGLGWIGRNNLLVHPRWGSRVRLVSILTDLPLNVGEPIEQDCGSCTKCVDMCPARAIKMNPADFDHIGC